MSSAPTLIFNPLVGEFNISQVTGGGGGGGGNSSGWIVIQSQVADAVATLNFTSGITPTYENYVLVYDNVTFDTSGQTLSLQVSTDGGATYIASGYSCTTLRFNDGGSGTNGYTDFVPLSELDASLGGSEGLAGTVFLFNLSTGNGTSSASGTCAYNRGTGDNGGSIISGTAENSEVINALQVATTSGTFSGTFTLYGIANVPVSSTGFMYNTVVGETVAAVKNNGYILTNFNPSTVSLPANGSTSVGDTFRVIGLSGSFTITQSADQQIYIGSDSSTSGDTGTVYATAGNFNGIELVCVSNAGGLYIWATVVASQGTFSTT